MSGGAYDYEYRRFAETYKGKTYDLELDNMIPDLADVLYKLEWWKSGDISQSEYRKAVVQFKEKWMRRTVEEHIRDQIEGECEELKRKLRATFLGEDMTVDELYEYLL